MNTFAQVIAFGLQLHFPPREAPLPDSYSLPQGQKPTAALLCLSVPSRNIPVAIEKKNVELVIDGQAFSTGSLKQQIADSRSVFSEFFTLFDIKPQDQASVKQNTHEALALLLAIEKAPQNAEGASDQRLSLEKAFHTAFGKWRRNFSEFHGQLQLMQACAIAITENENALLTSCLQNAYKAALLEVRANPFTDETRASVVESHKLERLAFLSKSLRCAQEHVTELTKIRVDGTPHPLEAAVQEDLLVVEGYMKVLDDARTLSAVDREELCELASKVHGIVSMLDLRVLTMELVKKNQEMLDLPSYRMGDAEREHVKKLIAEVRRMLGSETLDTFDGNSQTLINRIYNDLNERAGRHQRERELLSLQGI